MYLAKAQGKNRLVVYADGMAEAARRRAALAQDLAGAAAAGQLEVHYQPTVRLTDGRTTGFEALVRWNHPERGLVPPVEFIPLAEETGAHHRDRPLGAAARRSARAPRGRRRPARRCAWPSTSRRASSTTATSSPTSSPALRGDAASPREQLTLEVTEGVLVRDVDAVVAQLRVAAGPRRPHRHRRLRHRVLRAVLPAAPARRHHQDRPQLRHGPADRAARRSR